MGERLGGRPGGAVARRGTPRKGPELCERGPCSRGQRRTGPHPRLRTREPPASLPGGTAAAYALRRRLGPLPGGCRGPAWPYRRAARQGHAPLAGRRGGRCRCRPAPGAGRSRAVLHLPGQRPPLQACRSALLRDRPATGRRPVRPASDARQGRARAPRRTGPAQRGPLRTGGTGAAPAPPAPGVPAREALAPRFLPPLPVPLPVGPYPGRPPAYPEAPGAPDPSALDDLATDAAARAHTLLTTGADPVSGLTPGRTRSGWQRPAPPPD